jgi:hypothetical protein
MGGGGVIGGTGGIGGGVCQSEALLRPPWAFSPS